MITAIFAAAVLSCINPAAHCMGFTVDGTPMIPGCVKVPVRTMDGYVYMTACNVLIPGWRSMGRAPRDGTVIEIRNAYGLLPSYSINRWGDFGGYDAWVDAKPIPPCLPSQHHEENIKDKDGKIVGMTAWTSCSGIGGFSPDSEIGLAWRPYVGDPAKYVEHNPTTAQWRRAMRH